MTSSMAPLPPVAVPGSPWHSPVPYLFGGLAAMLGLIVFALLILTCSYCRKISPDDETDIESGNNDKNADSKPPVFEEKYLVIMAGHVNPTFLATPVSSQVSSFGSCSCRSNSTMSTDKSSESEVEKQGSFDQLQVRNTEGHLTAAYQLP